MTMNKKQYIQPTTHVVELQQAQVLCASGPKVNATGLGANESLDYGDGETKEKSIWDAY